MEVNSSSSDPLLLAKAQRRTSRATWNLAHERVVQVPVYGLSRGLQRILWRDKIFVVSSDSKGRHKMNTVVYREFEDALTHVLVQGQRYVHSSRVRLANARSKVDMATVQYARAVLSAEARACAVAKLT